MGIDVVVAPMPVVDRGSDSYLVVYAMRLKYVSRRTLNPCRKVKGDRLFLGPYKSRVFDLRPQGEYRLFSTTVQ